MNYRKITNLITKLKPNEAYTYFCLAVKSDYNTLESHIKQKNLLTFINGTGGKITERTLKNHIAKFKKLGLIEIKAERIQGQYGWFNRNTYNLTDEHYILVDNKLTELKISSELKGFLLIIRNLCFNGSSYMTYNRADITERVAFGKNKVGQLMSEAIDAGLIESKDGKFIFTRTDIFIETRLSLKEQVRMRYGQAFDEEELEQFNN